MFWVATPRATSPNCLIRGYCREFFAGTCNGAERCQDCLAARRRGIAGDTHEGADELGWLRRSVASLGGGVDEGLSYVHLGMQYKWDIVRISERRSECRARLEADEARRMTYGITGIVDGGLVNGEVHAKLGAGADELSDCVLRHWQGHAVTRGNADEVSVHGWWWWWQQNEMLVCVSTRLTLRNDHRSSVRCQRRSQPIGRLCPRRWTSCL